MSLIYIKYSIVPVVMHTKEEDGGDRIMGRGYAHLSCCTTPAEGTTLGSMLAKNRP